MSYEDLTKREHDCPKERLNHLVRNFLAEMEGINLHKKPPKNLAYDLRHRCVNFAECLQSLIFYIERREANGND